MPARHARAGRPADQGGLVVPDSMKRSVRTIPGLRSRGFADFRRGGRRGVFIGQACPRSCALANYPRRGGASHGARWRRGDRGAWNGGPVVRRAGRRRDQGRQEGRRRADPGQPSCATATTGNIVRIVRTVRQRGFIGFSSDGHIGRLGYSCRRPSDHAGGDSPTETDSCRTVRMVRTVAPPVWLGVLADLRETQAGQYATWHWPATHQGHKDRWLWWGTQDGRRGRDEL